MAPTHEISVAHSAKQLSRRVALILAPRDEVLEAYLFGSRAAGRAQPHSDIDGKLQDFEDFARLVEAHL